MVPEDKIAESQQLPTGAGARSIAAYTAAESLKSHTAAWLSSLLRLQVRKVHDSCLSVAGSRLSCAGLSITWLGTSSGSPTIERNVSCTVLRAPESTVLVDCGEGTQRQFAALGMDAHRVSE